ncbi:unnamed protein product, partial [Heterotrigona itama]
MINPQDQVHVIQLHEGERFEARSVDVDKYTIAESGTGNLKSPNNKHSSTARSWKFISNILWPCSTPPPTPETYGILSTKGIK